MHRSIAVCVRRIHITITNAKLIFFTPWSDRCPMGFILLSVITFFSNAKGLAWMVGILLTYIYYHPLHNRNGSVLSSILKSIDDKLSYFCYDYWIRVGCLYIARMNILLICVQVICVSYFVWYVSLMGRLKRRTTH